MQPLDIGHAAHGLDDDVGREPRAVSQCDAVLVEFLHSLAEVEGDAVRLVVSLHRCTELRTERAQHGLRVVRRHRDLAAELACGRCHLAADETRADDEQARAGSESLTQVQRVLGGAQHRGLGTRGG